MIDRFFSRATVVILTATLAIACLLLPAAIHAAPPAPVTPADVSPEMRQAIVDRSVASTSNFARLHRVIQKAQRGEPVTLGFIGGSITEGSGAKPMEENCYARHVFEWWQKQFPQSKATYINAGIGSTGSDYGTFRAKYHLLDQPVDLVVVEFSVNDPETEFHKQTMEGLLRQILVADNQPAVIMLHTMYVGGINRQDMHAAVADHYHIPRVSYRDALWPEVEAKRMDFKSFTADRVHPNNAGHQWAALFVTNLIQKAIDTLPASASNNEASDTALPAPLTTDLYQFTEMYHFSTTQNDGIRLTPDQSQWLRNVRGRAPGESQTVTIPDATMLAVRVRVWKRPFMARASVVIDNREPVILDSWVEYAHYPYRQIFVIAKDLKPGPHTITFTVLDDRSSPDKPSENQPTHEFSITHILAAGVGQQAEAN